MYQRCIVNDITTYRYQLLDDDRCYSISSFLGKTEFSETLKGGAYYRTRNGNNGRCCLAEVDSEIVKAKRATRERPISFTKMDDIKNRWETTSQQGRREVQREARKEEIAGIRSRLFMVNSRSFSGSLNRYGASYTVISRTRRSHGVRVNFESI